MSERAPIEPSIEIVPVESQQDVFKNKNQMWDPRRGYRRAIFGGQLLAQSVLAAKQTVPAAFAIHSLQATFLRAGDGIIDVTYHVERALDGRTLATRLVRAMQGDVVIYVVTIGFQRYTTPAENVLRYDTSIPTWAKSVEPGDSNLLNARDMLIEAGFDKSLVEALKDPLEWFHLPIETTQNPSDFCARSIIRSSALSTDDRSIHLAALAYMSDVWVIHTVNLANPDKFPLGLASAVIQTTVNHSVWFHSPSTRVDDWLVCERRTSWGADGRVLIHQTLWNKAGGQLVLSCIQEAWIRLKSVKL